MEQAIYHDAPAPGAAHHNVRTIRRPGGSGSLSILQAIAVDDRRMKEAPLRMLLCLGTYADVSTRLVTTSAKTIGARLGISRQAAQKTLRELSEWGYIEIIDRHDAASGAQLSSYYRLLMDVAIPPAERRSVRSPRILQHPGVDAVGCTPATSEVAGVPVSETAPGLQGVQPQKLHPPATSEVAAIKRPGLTAPVNGVNPEYSGSGVRGGADAPTPPPQDDKPKRKSRRTTKLPEPEMSFCPDTIELTEVSYATAKDLGYTRTEVERELDAFITKAQAKGWSNVNWRQAFKNWLIGEIKYGRGPATLGPKAPARQNGRSTGSAPGAGWPGAPVSTEARERAQGWIGRECPI